MLKSLHLSDSVNLLKQFQSHFLSDSEVLPNVARAKSFKKSQTNSPFLNMVYP